MVERVGPIKRKLGQMKYVRKCRRSGQSKEVKKKEEGSYRGPRGDEEKRIRRGNE